jgi:amino acid permease
VPETTRNAPGWVTWLLVLVGILCLGGAIVYFARTADQLPSFFPGHAAGVARHHTKHGIVLLGLAIVCWIGAWFTTGSRGERAR